MTARIVQRELVKPGDAHLMVFTDTLYEDADLYRFLIEGGLNVFGRRSNWIPAAEDFPDYRITSDMPLAEYAGNPAWRAFLAEIRDRAAEALPELAWLVEGRDPWEVYRDERFLGNSRADPCSKIQKRQMLDRWRNQTLDPADTAIYFGIGTAEKHRYEAWDEEKQRFTGIRPRYAADGWRAEAPLIGRIEGDLSSTLYMAQQGILAPRLYKHYAHNNCGGMCCKAGMNHWKVRYYAQPERYAYDAMMEGKVAAFLGRDDVAFLTDRRSDDRVPITLRALAAELEQQPDLFAVPMPGDDGCGCMIEEPAE